MNKKRIVMGLASLAEKREEIMVGNNGGKYWLEILVGNNGGIIIYISIVDTQKRATK
jgi:hypothetical protein